MSKKTVISLFFLFLLPVILYFLWPSDESRIKKIFREGARAIEQENIEEVMGKVSFNYRDDYGLSYLYIKEGMERVFHKMSDIKIEYENLNIVVKEKTATAEVDVRVVATIGSETGYIIGDLPNPVHMKFTLEKERTKWLVTKLEGLPVWW
ncbi:MAG: hypothetical protein RDU01_01165 [Thermodesulfovibrionales bacterium]|nr:hypothetical protein [Thermodesulfovibrionales bacterium]